MVEKGIILQPDTVKEIRELGTFHTLGNRKICQVSLKKPQVSLSKKS